MAPSDDWTGCLDPLSVGFDKPKVPKGTSSLSCFGGQRRPRALPGVIVRSRTCAADAYTGQHWYAECRGGDQ